LSFQFNVSHKDHNFRVKQCHFFSSWDTVRHPLFCPASLLARDQLRAFDLSRPTWSSSRGGGHFVRYIGRRRTSALERSENQDEVPSASIGINLQWHIQGIELSSVLRIFHIWSSSFDWSGMLAASMRPSWDPSWLMLAASGSILFFSSSDAASTSSPLFVQQQAQSRPKRIRTPWRASAENAK